MFAENSGARRNRRTPSGIFGRMRTGRAALCRAGMDYDGYGAVTCIVELR